MEKFAFCFNAKNDVISIQNIPISGLGLKSNIKKREIGKNLKLQEYVHMAQKCLFKKLFFYFICHIISL